MALPVISDKGFVISEVRGQTTKSGKSMATFATAHSKSKKDEQTGEWERVNQMVINWVAFDADAEHILASVEPKTEVHVVGEIYEDSWTSPDTGEVRNSVKGIVKACSASIPRRDGNSGGGSGSVW